MLEKQWLHHLGQVLSSPTSSTVFFLHKVEQLDLSQDVHNILGLYQEHDKFCPLPNLPHTLPSSWDDKSTAYQSKLAEAYPRSSELIIVFTIQMQMEMDTSTLGQQEPQFDLSGQPPFNSSDQPLSDPIDSSGVNISIATGMEGTSWTDIGNITALTPNFRQPNPSGEFSLLSQATGGFYSSTPSHLVPPMGSSSAFSPYHHIRSHSQPTTPASLSFQGYGPSPSALSFGPTTSSGTALPSQPAPSWFMPMGQTGQGQTTNSRATPPIPLNLRWPLYPPHS
jgi:hypothetical protein